MDVKKISLVALRLCVNRDYRLVRRLGIFDPDYYLHRRPLQRGDDPDPLWAFWAYLHADRSWEKMLLSGRRWLAPPEPHPLFDTCYYLSRYFPKGLAENPFGHYLRLGWKKGYHPGPYFDPEMYRTAAGWHEGLGDPLTHYTHHGARRGISPGQFFDVAWYLDRNPVLIPARGTIVRHYKIYGAPSGKSPIPVFSPEFYLARLNDPAEARQDPLAHYLTTAADGQMRPAEWFEPAYYRVSGCGDDDSPLGHYLRCGVFQGCFPDARVSSLAKQPLVSIVVPVYNPDIGTLNNCIRSVLYQAYPHWQLCLADDGSTSAGVAECLAEWAGRDGRIRVTSLPSNQGIVAASNAAAALAEGEYLGFLDHDDELTVDCLYRLVVEINRTGAELLYSDEDLIGDDGRCFSIFHKPDFNPELLLSHNYITHFVGVSASLFRRIGGLAAGYDGAQDYDLLLRAAEMTPFVQHIAKVLYHWRAASTSTSINHQGKPYAHAAGSRALAGSLKRRGMAATVLDSEHNFFYRIRPETPIPPPPVAVVIYDGAGHWTRERLARVQKATLYPNCRMVLLTANPDRGGEGPAGNEVMAMPRHGNRARALDQALLSCPEEYLVLVDGLASHVDPDWLNELVGWGVHDPGGMVCGRICRDGGDGPSYTLPNLGDVTAAYFAAFLAQASRHMNGVHCLQRLSCCGWDPCLLHRDLYRAAGGLDWQNFPELLAMVDFSLRLSQAGGRVLYTPYARVTHALPEEASAAKYSGNHSVLEKELFQRRWQHWLQVGDPYYNRAILSANGIDPEQFIFWLCGPPQR